MFGSRCQNDEQCVFVVASLYRIWVTEALFVQVSLIATGWWRCVRCRVCECAYCSVYLKHPDSFQRVSHWVRKNNGKKGRYPVNGFQKNHPNERRGIGHPIRSRLGLGFTSCELVFAVLRARKVKMTKHIARTSLTDSLVYLGGSI